MGRPRKDATGTNKPLAVFATVLIVVGIAAVAYTSSMKAPLSGSAQSAPRSASVTAATEPTSTFLLVNDSSATLLSLGGQPERLTYEQFRARFDGRAIPVEGANAANGAVADNVLAFAATNTTDGRVSPDGKYTAHLESPKADGAVTVSLTRKGDGDVAQTLVLRLNGKPLKEALFLGWLDAQTMAVSAVATGTHDFYALATSGSLTQIGRLPDNTTTVEVRGGRIWYVTATQGEGLESPPAAPSELHRIGLDGKNELLVRDGLHVILTGTASVSGWLVYTTEDGQSFAMKDGDTTSRIALGKQHPLLFAEDGRLLFRDGFDLRLLDLATGGTEKVGTLPEGDIDIFVLPTGSTSTH